MPVESELREGIVGALAGFGGQPMREAATKFLATLGYRSDRTLDLGNSSPRAFIEMVNSRGDNTSFNESKALFSHWASVDILFQLTDEELSGHSSLFRDTTIEVGLLRSYLFFAIELTGGDYPRGKLTSIARQINRVFAMPVMVLIRHLTDKKPVLSIAVINRRQNKRDADRDVLGKVTIIRDVALTQPHRGHLDILASFALPNLVHPQHLPINNFDHLHAAWEEIFNVELLNRRFYRELANWYFWALPQVEFPDDTEKDDDKRRATSLIRLLTRLIFCWFLKEKGLIPERLFVEAELERILVGLAPDACTYHQAILQNLFFATLNQRMGKDRNGLPYRAFARDEGFPKNRANYGVDTLYRYEELFRDRDTALDQFADVPFLNGGLFECLDRIEDRTNRKLYVDGFSRNWKKRPRVPNCLFFAEEQRADLSDAYGEPKRRNETVRGLLRILHSYKFTIVENTPIDQEIALDPELLGKVFENLLACYNEETKTTARKQTGSFYTPRPIVEYMVDEALKGRLARSLVEEVGMVESDALTGLELLFTYTEREHVFSEAEVACLVASIDSMKVLDPACGSGAFPMGVLHKLVYILGKLDPNNQRWKQRQLAKLDSVTMREELERSFCDNDDDYGRKLYLIENCLYGVDIQPVAIQITKLRFFISLVCDQRTGHNKKENRGIRPLPNLETKFVVADTLIGLPGIDYTQLIDPRVERIEKEIESNYHSHFSIQRRQQKLVLQRKVKDLRTELAAILAVSLMSPAKSKHIAEWDPFDPQSCADFFDPHWMFGRALADGFDIVIGNPPYQSAIDHKKSRGDEYRNLIKKRYLSARGAWDLYIPFFEAGLNLCRDGGLLSFISPNKYLSATYGIGLRQLLPGSCRIEYLTDVSHLPVFETASVYPVISMFRKALCIDSYEIRLHLPKSRESRFYLDEYEESKQSSDCLTLLPDNLWGFLLSPNLPVLQRLLAGASDLKSLARVCATTTAAEADELGKLLRPYPAAGWKTLNTGTIDPFMNAWEEQPMRHHKQSVARPILPNVASVSENRRSLYSTPKIIVAKMALSLEGYVDREGEYAALNCNCISEPEANWTLDALAVVLHSTAVAFAYRQYYDGLRMSGGYFPFQAPQLKCIPIPNCDDTTIEVLDRFGKILAFLAKEPELPGYSAFFGDLADACVMECYFREHMLELDLCIVDACVPHVVTYKIGSNQGAKRNFLAEVYEVLNAPGHPVRNRLLRMSADSPDLLAIVKREGAV